MAQLYLLHEICTNKTVVYKNGNLRQQQQRHHQKISSKITSYEYKCKPVTYNEFNFFYDHWCAPYNQCFSVCFCSIFGYCIIDFVCCAWIVYNFFFLSPHLRAFFNSRESSKNEMKLISMTHILRVLYIFLVAYYSCQIMNLARFFHTTENGVFDCLCNAHTRRKRGSERER